MWCKMQLVDSTVLVDFLRGKEKAVGMLGKGGFVPYYTTEINVFELITGAYMVKTDVKTHLEKVFALLSKMIVLPLDRKATLKAGEIGGMLKKEGMQIEECDCLIAGIALTNGINEVITENKAHFERIDGIKVVSYGNK